MNSGAVNAVMIVFLFPGEHQKCDVNLRDDGSGFKYSMDSFWVSYYLCSFLVRVYLMCITLNRVSTIMLLLSDGFSYGFSMMASSLWNVQYSWLKL